MSDDSLVEYIGELLRQGYTEDQVIQTLREKGYPESLIESSFSILNQGASTEAIPGTATPSSAADQLASYLRVYLAQGYDLEQLKQSLVQQGYKAKDVEAAANAATGTVRHEHHVSGATIFKLAFLVLFIAGIVYGVMFLRGTLNTETPITEGTQLLDVTLSLDAAAVKAGATTTILIEDKPISRPTTVLAV